MNKQRHKQVYVDLSIRIHFILLFSAYLRSNRTLSCKAFPVFVRLAITLCLAFSRNSGESSIIPAKSILGLNFPALPNVVLRFRLFHLFLFLFHIAWGRRKERLYHCHSEFKCCSLCSSLLISFSVRVLEKISVSGQEHISLRSMQTHLIVPQHVSRSFSFPFTSSLNCNLYH